MMSNDEENDEGIEYLGDGLYASFDGYQICLMANSHTAPTDTVYLDPSVYANLVKFMRRFSEPKTDAEIES